MASIRARVTTAYALALAGTLVAFAVAVGTARRTTAYRDLQNRVTTLADIGERIVRQVAEQNRPLTEVTDSLVGRQITRPLQTLMEGVPDYLVVVDDSGRFVYASFAVRQLTPDDLNGLSEAIFKLSADRPLAVVTLANVQLLAYARFTVVTPDVPIQMIVAGASTSGLSFLRSELPVVFLLVAPLVIVLSVTVARQQAVGARQVAIG